MEYRDLQLLKKIISDEYCEQLYNKLAELEAKEEARILEQ